jgi:hypothetical protein
LKCGNKDNKENTRENILQNPKNTDKASKSHDSTIEVAGSERQLVGYQSQRRTEEQWKVMKITIQHRTLYCMATYR